MDHTFYFDFASPVILKEKLKGVEIGQVTTVGPEEEARVETRTDGDTVLLDFALPRGEEGFSSTATVKTADAPFDNAAFAPGAKCVSVTLTDKDGEKSFSVPPAGIYAHPIVAKGVMGNELTLSANTHYFHQPIYSTDGYLKLELSSENSWNTTVPIVRFLDSWRILFGTGTVGSSQYIGTLHLHKSIHVPADWTGQDSSRFPDYKEYSLMEKTIYDITVEESGIAKNKFLSYKTWNS